MPEILPLKNDDGIICEFNSNDVVSIQNGGTGANSVANVLSNLGIKDAVLITTEKTEIINNRIQLQSKPFGDILLGLAIVYGTNGVEEYDGITIIEEFGLFYACFNESVSIIGKAVVSYITYI